MAVSKATDKEVDQLAKLIRSEGERRLGCLWSAASTECVEIGWISRNFGRYESHCFFSPTP